jgi:hypothetical protein
MQWFYQRVYAAASRLRGTEAIAFAVSSRGLLTESFHIRPDDPPPEKRRAAIEAFRDIVAPCVDENRDDFVQVSNATAMEPVPQFCLVKLIREGVRVIAAVAVICRCADANEASQRLDALRKML